ncbi:hypothetical protein [Streptomyces sp. NPDC056660]|uniref:hypothetical protein n=1 Tax=Streptomyces sp. NPDC056660 TaxID=3345897 RepID=UPI00369340D3
MNENAQISQSGISSAMARVGAATAAPQSATNRMGRLGVKRVAAQPSDRLARVGSYDMLGSVVATPFGALLASLLAATIGIRPAQFAAVFLAVSVSVLALAPKEVRTDVGWAAGHG